MSLKKKIEARAEEHARGGMLKKYLEDMSTIFVAVGQVLSKRGYKDQGILNFYSEMNEFLPEHLQTSEKEE